MARYSSIDSFNLKGGLKAIKLFGRELARERTGDYGVTLSALAAGIAGTSAQMGRAQRDLVAGNANAARHLTSLTQRAKNVQRGVSRSQARTVNEVGSALGGAVATAYGPARATGRAGVLEARGNAAEGAGIAQAGQTAIGIAGALTQGLEAAGQYALAQALQQRTIIDNQTLAQLTGDLYKTALSYNMQWQLYKREQDYAQKKASNEAKPIVQRLTSEGVSIAADAADTIRGARVDGVLPDDFDITAAAQTWATQNGYDPAGPEAGLYAATLRNIKSGMNAPTAYSAAINQLYGGLPGFDKWGQPLINASMAGVQAEALQRYTSTLATDPETAASPDYGWQDVWGIFPGLFR